MKLIRLIIAAACLTGFSANAQTIKLKLVKGLKYEVTTASDVRSVASVMGQEMESIANTSNTESYEVTDTRPNETDLKSTMTKMKVSASAMGQETNYDSDKKDNSGPGAEEMNKQIGKVKTMTIDVNGKLIKESNADGEQIGGAMSGIAKEAVPLLLRPFIGREVKTGASWYDSITVVTDKITTTTAGNYTITAIDVATNTVTVGFIGTAKVTGTMEQMGQEMEMTSTSTVTGVTQVDMNTGLIKQSSSTTDGTMNIEAGGMSIPVTLKSTTTTTVKQL